jgi:hypothetical protein
MATWTCMTLRDEQTGAGDSLAFPSMSTCSAIICRLDATLVGIHKPAGWFTNVDRLFQNAATIINGAAIRSLFILGWTLDDAAAHDVTLIRNTLGCQAVDTYTYNFSNAKAVNGAETFQAPRSFGKIVADLCTLAEHQNNDDPLISVKRTSKVVVTPIDDAQASTLHYQAHGNNARFRAVDEDVTINSGNTHRIRKTLDFDKL